MKSKILRAVLILTVALSALSSPAATMAQADTTPANKSYSSGKWYLYGCWKSKSTAQYYADYLQSYGYQTKIKKSGNKWDVYYYGY